MPAAQRVKEAGLDRSRGQSDVATGAAGAAAAARGRGHSVCWGTQTGAQRILSVSPFSSFSVCVSLFFSHSPKNLKNSKKSKTRHPFSRVLYRAGTVGRAARTRHTRPKRHPVGLSTQYMKVPLTTRKGRVGLNSLKIRTHTAPRGWFLAFL